MPSWKDSLKASAVEAMREASYDLFAPARQLLRDLDKAGKTVSLNATADGLVVRSPPIPADLAERIRANRDQLVELLKGNLEVWRWKPADLMIEVSLCDSHMRDLVIAPPVDGLFHVKLKPTMVNAILEGASAEWRAKIKQLGGLVAYPISSLLAVKEALAKKGSV